MSSRTDKHPGMFRTRRELALFFCWIVLCYAAPIVALWAVTR